MGLDSSQRFWTWMCWNLEGVVEVTSEAAVKMARELALKEGLLKRGCIKRGFYCTTLKHLCTMKIECSEERMSKEHQVCEGPGTEWQSKGGLDLSRRCHSPYDRFLRLQLQRR